MCDRVARQTFVDVNLDPESAWQLFLEVCAGYLGDYCTGSIGGVDFRRWHGRAQNG